jgi:cell division septation protein DedD
MAPANGAAQEADPAALPPASLPAVVATSSVVATDTYIPAQAVSGPPEIAPTQLPAPMAAPASPGPPTVATPLVAEAHQALPLPSPDAAGTTANSSDRARDAGDVQERAMVEIMTLSHETDADAMVAALKRHGYSVAVNRDPHDSLLHLEVGPFASKAAAETMRQRLLLDGYDATIK